MTTKQTLRDIRAAFSRVFGSPAAMPRVFCAPGRTNLIGEHTDYNDGFVLPAAIDRSTCVAISPRADSTLRVHSENYNEMAAIDLDETSAAPQRNWSDYVHGVALMLLRAGMPLRGADLLIRSNVPLGAGLSSSAAIEVAVATALFAACERAFPPLEIARLCQRSENEFVGARCGIMDQFVACFGRASHAIFLDCRSLEHAAVPLPPHIALILCNTMVKHENAAGEYNARRRECEEAVAILAKVIPAVRALRDVTPDQVDARRGLLSETLYKRARHVATENARVLNARAALKCGDLANFGRLMSESHASLRDHYEVSCRELDVMVRRATEFDGCIGARMTGGGFGGCTVNLVPDSKADAFVSHMREGYMRATGISPEIYTCVAADGAHEIA